MLRNRCFQIEWFESAYLLQFDAPLSRQFERRDETRRDRRAAQRTVIVARQEIGEFGPVELHPQHPLKMMQRSVERDDRAARHHMHDRSEEHTSELQSPMRISY